MNPAAAALEVTQLSVCLHASAERQSCNVSQALLGCLLAVKAELGPLTLLYSKDPFSALMMQHNATNSSMCGKVRGFPL